MAELLSQNRPALFRLTLSLRTSPFSTVSPLTSSGRLLKYSHHEKSPKTVTRRVRNRTFWGPISDSLHFLNVSGPCLLAAITVGIGVASTSAEA